MNGSNSSRTTFSDSSNQSRAIVASRDQADYAQPLGLPRVEIDPLSDDQIRAFLQEYVGEQADGALATISAWTSWSTPATPTSSRCWPPCMILRAVICRPIGAASLPHMRTR